MLMMPSSPEATMIDNLLAINAMGDLSMNFQSLLSDIAVLFGTNSYDVWTEYRDTRKFRHLHNILFETENHGNHLNLNTSLK